MSAKDHLNRELFHGTHSQLGVGEVLQPSTQGYGTEELHSFATTNPELAEISGPNIYKVEPVDPSDLSEDPYNTDDEDWKSAFSEKPLNYSSRSGFRVVGKY